MPAQKKALAPSQRRIRHLSPQDEAFTRAQRFAERAQYDDALAILGEVAGNEQALLKAQILVRLRQYSDARDTLESIKDAPRSVAAETASLLTSIADRLAIAKATSASKLAVPVFPAGVDARTRTQRLYYEALAHWMRKSADIALELTKKVTAGDDSLLRAWGLDLEAWIAVSRGKYGVAAKAFRAVLDTLNEAPSKDEFARCSALHSLCFISVETLNAAYFRRIVSESQTMLASPVTARLRVQILSYVSIIESVEGKTASAYGALLSARAIEAPQPFRALPDIQLATFHRQRKAPEAASLHLDFAKASLDTIAWEDADIEARLVLALYLVEAAAEKRRPPTIGPLRALSIDGKRDPMLALEGNELAGAMALFARANLAISASRPDAAIDDLQRAKEIWHKHGWSYREAIAELTMLQINESADVPTLDKVASTFPASHLAADFASERRRAESPLRLLTAAERRVLNGICEGLTSKQIAETLDRSSETVRVQTLSIYRKLGVNTRSALVALIRDADAS